MAKTLARHGLIAEAILLSAASAIAIAACSNDEGTNNISADLFPSAYAQALCGSLQHCCDENQVALNFATCTEGWKAYVQTLLSGPSELTNYDPRAAKACVDAIRTASGVSCQPVAGSISDARATCLGIFVGRKAIGQPCATAAECAPDPSGGRVACEASPNATEGGVLPLSVVIRDLAITSPVCVLVPSAEEGAPCLIDPNSVQSNCGEDLYCDPTTTTCIQLGTIGASCVAGSCAPGGICATSGTNAGKCVPTSALGGACAALSDCDTSSRCDLTTKTCVAKKEAGESCTDDLECSVGICDATTKKCFKNSIATANTCNGKPQ